MRTRGDILKNELNLDIKLMPDTWLEYKEAARTISKELGKTVGTDSLYSLRCLNVKRGSPKAKWFKPNPNRTNSHLVNVAGFIN